MASLLIIDDHQLFADAITVAVRRHGIEVLGVAATGIDGVALAVETKPDVVLVDVGLPDANGLDVGEAILAALPGVRVLVVTGLESEAVATEAVRRGLHAYVSKDTSVGQFLDAIDAVLNGHVVVSDDLAPAARLSGTSARMNTVHIHLTDRERQVLERLVDGVDTRSMARELGISGNTVRTHVQNVLTKLQVHSRLEAASVALRYGLVSPGPHPRIVGTEPSSLVRSR
jgi:two-component system, NarL family, nitrate/nitrite response regulator NarL